MIPNRYVHYADLRATDVLVGRGAFTDRYRGNVWFRSLVAGRKSMHAATKRVAEKTSLVFEVREVVWRSGGRFLRRNSSAEAKRLGWMEGVHETTIWEPIGEEVALEKIKQAFRDIALMPRAQDTNQTSKRKPPPQQDRLAVGSKRQKTDSTAVEHESLSIPASIEFVNQGDVSDDDRKMPPKNPTTKFSAAELQEKDSSGMFTRAGLMELAERYQASKDVKHGEAAPTHAATAGSSSDTFDPAPAVGFSTQASIAQPPKERPNIDAQGPEVAPALAASFENHRDAYYTALSVGPTVPPPNLDVPLRASFESQSTRDSVFRHEQDDIPHAAPWYGVASTAPVDPPVREISWRDILTGYEVWLPEVHRFAAPPFTGTDLQELLLIGNLAAAEGDRAVLGRLRLVCIQVAHLPTGQLELGLNDIECLQTTMQCLASIV